MFCASGTSCGGWTKFFFLSLFEQHPLLSTPLFLFQLSLRISPLGLLPFIGALLALILAFPASNGFNPLSFSTLPHFSPDPRRRTLTAVGHFEFSRAPCPSLEANFLFSPVQRRVKLKPAKKLSIVCDVFCPLRSCPCVLIPTESKRRTTPVFKRVPHGW